MPGMRDRRVALVFGVISVAMAAVAAPALGQTTSCLNDIEHWMREYQARHQEITGQVAEFPECCPDSRASAYPKDDYYDDALKDNPAFAAKLVKGLRDAMLCRPQSPAVFQSFLSVPVEELEGRDGGDVPMMSATTFSDRGITCSTQVTTENFCDVYSALRDIIRGMKTRPLVSPTNEPCFSWTEPPPEPGQANCVYRGGTSVGAPGGPCSNPPYCECGGELPSCPNWDLVGSGRVLGYNDCPHSPTAAYALAYGTALCVYNYGWQGSQGVVPAPHSYVSMSIQATVPDAGNPTQVCYGASVAMETWRGRLSIDAKNRKGKLHIVSVMTGDALPSSAAGEPPVTAFGSPVAAAKLDNKQRIIEASLDVNQSGLTYSPVWGSNDGGNGTWGDCSDLNNMPSPTQPCLPNPVPGNLPLSQSMSWAIGATNVYITPEYDTRAEDQRDCGTDCGTCLPGEPKPGTKGLNTSFPLGMLSDGTSAGYIALRSDRLTQGCYPQDLLINVPDAVYQVTVDDIDNRFCPPRTRSLRQLYTGDMLVEIIPTPCEQNIPCGFQILFKKVGPNLLPDGNGQYSTNQPPFYSSCIKHVPGQVPDPNNPSQLVVGDILRIDSTKEGVTKTLEYVQVGDDWMLRSGFGTPAGTPIRAERTLTDALGNGDRQVTQIVSNASGSEPASRMVETHRVFAWGEELIDRRIGASGSEQVETYNYYSIEPLPGQTDHNNGRLKSVVTSTGNWRHFEYDARGRIIREIAQFKDGALNAANATALNSTAAANREVVITYLDATDLDGDSVGDLVVERIEKLLGVAVARSYTVTWSAANLTVPGGSAVSAVQTWEIQCASPTYSGSMGAYLVGLRTNNAWRTGADRVSATWREAVSPFRTLMSQSSSGSMSWTKREDLAGGGKRTTSYSGLANSAWNGLRAGSGTRSVSEKNAQRVTVLRTSEEQDTSGSWVRTSKSWVTGADIDLFNRVLVERFDDTGDDLEDGRTTRVYSCCGLQSDTDRDGITTTYGHDELGRTIWTQTPLDANRSIRTGTIFDAAGNVLSETRTPYTGTTAGATVTLRTNAYDLAGRLVWTKDALNATSTYSEQVLSNPTRVVRAETLPDPDGAGPEVAPYVTTISWPDGSQQSVGGTGAHPAAYDSGLEAMTVGGPLYRYTKTALGVAGTQWNKSYSNALGQVVRTVFADGAYEESFYNFKGERVQRRTSGTDGMSVLTFSGIGNEDRGTLPVGGQITGVDFSGRWTLSVQDLDGDGFVDFEGDDRITLSMSTLGTREVGGSTVPVRRSTSLVWSTIGNSNAVTETGVSDSTLDGRRNWATRFGRTSETVTTVTPATASRVTTSTAPSGATTIETISYGRSTKSESFLPPSMGGAAVSAVGITYDAHGRVQSQTLYHGAFNSSLSTQTSSSYDAADRVITRTEPSPDPANPTRTTTMVHDALGRVTTVIQPDNKQTTHAYAPTGEVVATIGFGVPPVAYGYDDLGRMVTLLTYQNFDNGNGDPQYTSWSFESLRGRLVAKHYDDNSAVTYTYSPSGRLQTRTWARGVTTTYGYSAAGELAVVEYSDGTPSVQMWYDRLGRATTVSDAAGLRELTYRENGQPLSETIGEGGSMNLLKGTRATHAYDGDNRSLLTAQVGHNGQGGYAWQSEAAYAYDPLDRISQVRRPGDLSANFTYHPVFGSVTRTDYVRPDETDPVFWGTRGHRTTGALDSVAWERALEGGGGSAITHMFQHAYDVHGRRTRTYEGVYGKDDVHWKHAYDDRNQLIETYGEIQPPGTPPPPAMRLPGANFNYVFDDIGNRTESFFGGGDDGSNQSQVIYGVDNLNRYIMRQSPGEAWIVGHVPPPLPSNAGVLIGSTSNTLENASRMSPPLDAWYWRALQFDNNEPLAEDVTVWTIPGGQTIFPLYVPKAAEEFSHDADGNMTGDSIWTYEWDGENRLKAMQMKPGRIMEILLKQTGWLRLEFGYDYMSRRISKRVITSLLGPEETAKALEGGEFNFDKSSWTKFVYDTASFNMVMSYRANPATGEFESRDRSYLWGPDLSATLTGAGGIGGLALTYNDHADAGLSGNGVVGAMLPAYDGNGNLVNLYAVKAGGCDGSDVCPVATYDYGPFGEVRSMTGEQAAGNPMRWSTKFTDNETGLVYYGYRYYHAGLGRWVSRDPLGEGSPSRALAASNQYLPRVSTIGPNHYAFVENDPIGSIDPFGLFMSGVHKDLTRDAVKNSTVQFAKGCKDKISAILIEANTGQDSGAAFEMLDRHFNRPYVESETYDQRMAARRTWDAKFMTYLRSEESTFTASLAGGDCKGALEALGRVTHSWQDFYAHAISTGYRQTSPYFEDGHFIRFKAWTEGHGGSPDYHPELWPSSYNSPYAWAAGEHPNLSEPVSGEEARLRQAEARMYTTDQYNTHLERWRVACPCWCQSK